MRNQELHPRTAVINKKQKNLAKKARQDALNWLTVQFPKAFDNTVSIQPLKIGIMDDILQHADNAVQAGISKSKLREAVVIYTRRIDYLTCLKAREMRVDLEGNPVSTVTEDEAAKASSKIKKRVEKSAKNARKSNSSPSTRPTYQAAPKVAPGNSFSMEQDSASAYYADRPALYSMANTQKPARATAVTIKHKTSRQFDPDAVARLKEKLGLAKVEEKEMV